MRVVNTSVRKKDAMQLVTGQPVYVDDLAPQDCLIVKLLRSPVCECDGKNDQHRDRNESSGHRGNLYLGGCAAGCKALHTGGADIPGGEPV